MRTTRNLIVLSVALLVAAAVPANAVSTEWSIFLSWYDSTDLQDALGLGVRASFPFGENWEFDVTAAYYEDFEDAVPGAAKVEVGTIPLDFGITWTKSADGGFYAGGGLTYAFMDLGALEIAGVDIPQRGGEADDEFGAFGKLGYRARNGFLFELLYRFLDVSIEGINPEVAIPEFGNRIDLDMDGFVINIGYRF